MAFLNWNVAARPAQEQYGNYENYMTSINTAGTQQTDGLSDDEQEELSSGLNGNSAVAGDSFVRTTGEEQESDSLKASAPSIKNTDADSIHEKTLKEQADTYDPDDEAGSTSQAYTATNLAKEASDNANKKIEYAKAAKTDADAQVIRAQADVENSKGKTVMSKDGEQVPNTTELENANKSIADAKANQLVADRKLEDAEKEAAEAEKKYVYAKQNQDYVFNADYSSNPFSKNAA